LPCPDSETDSGHGGFRAIDLGQVFCLNHGYVPSDGSAGLRMGSGTRCTPYATDADAPFRLSQG
jgi:hypothetical protein